MSVLYLWVLLLLPLNACGADIRRGIAVLRASDYYKSLHPSADVVGTVTFTQASEDGPVTVAVDASGLDSAASELGFHVHNFGDATNTMTVDTLGVHLTPSCTIECKNDSTHGFPPSPIRQWGDMGNLPLSGGAVSGYTELLGQNKMSLSADGLDPLGEKWNQRSIVGRAVVVHSKKDDGSQPFGAAGAPHAWGIIGLAVPGDGDTNVGAAYRSERAVCIFQKSKTQSGVVVEGTALVTWSYMDNQLRLEAKIQNLDAGEHSFHFHEWGDLAVEPTSLGVIFDDKLNLVLVATGSAETVFDTKFAGKSSDVSRLTGRMLTVHSGPTKEFPTIGTAVCGRAAPDTELFPSTKPPTEEGSSAAHPRAASLSTSTALALAALAAVANRAV